MRVDKISLDHPGETESEVSRLTSSPEPERGRGQQHTGKAVGREKLPKLSYRKTWVAGRKLNCLKLNSDGPGRVLSRRQLSGIMTYAVVRLLAHGTSLGHVARY